MQGTRIFNELTKFSEVVEDPPLVLASFFFEDKDRGVPRAIGFSDVALGKQLLHKGFQGAQFFLREGPLEDPYQIVLFPGDLGDNGYCTLNSDPN